MNKLTLSLIILTIQIYSVASFAQSFFGLGGNKKEEQKSSTTAPTAGSVRVLSPKDFKSTVNTLNKQTQDHLSEQLSQQISKRPATPAVQSTTSPPPTTIPVAPITGAAPTTPSPVIPAPTVAPMAPPPQYAPSPSTIVVTPPANQTQQPVYSGFQGPQDTQKNNTQPKSGTQSGGWNIKY